MMDWYNGFTPAERAANGKALSKGLKDGSVAKPSGPCTLCGDPNSTLEYHSEDYAKPYRWTQPAAYPVCQSCHRNKLHKRFANPKMWETFVAHVRRGGYASDLANPAIKRELAAYEAGTNPTLEQLRPYAAKVGNEWWANLTMDPASLHAEGARPKRQ
jgi:hypothetical protein